MPITDRLVPRCRATRLNESFSARVCDFALRDGAAAEPVTPLDPQGLFQATAPTEKKPARMSSFDRASFRRVTSTQPVLAILAPCFRRD